MHLPQLLPPEVVAPGHELLSPGSWQLGVETLGFVLRAYRTCIGFVHVCFFVFVVFPFFHHLLFCVYLGGDSGFCILPLASI